MLDQGLLRKQAALQRHEALVLDHLAVEIDRDLALDRIPLQDRGRDIAQGQAQNLVEQAGDTAGDVALIGPDHVRDMKLPLGIGDAEIGLAGLDPQVRDQDLQRMAVPADAVGQAGDAEDRDDRTVKTAGGQDQDIGLTYRAKLLSL